MSTVSSSRRYYLLKRLAARSNSDRALDAAWHGMQKGVPGTALPLNFPARAELVAAGYSAIEDVFGADVDELLDAGLTRSEATAAIAAAEI